MNRKEYYEAQEAEKHLSRMLEIEKQTPDEKREAAEAFRQAMATTPEIIAERAGWLLSGEYGYGAMIAAQRNITGRGNRAARICQMIGALEWLCPPAWTRKVWHGLTKEQQDTLDRCLREAIEAYEDYQKEVEEYEREAQK